MAGRNWPLTVNIIEVGTAGIVVNGIGPPVGTTTAEGTSPFSSNHRLLITSVRSRMSAISGTSSIAPCTIIGPASPLHAWCAVAP